MPSFNAQIRAERRPIDELTDSQIESLMAFGRREAEVIDAMEAAARAGKRNLVWQLAEALVRIQDEAQAVTKE